MTIKSLIFLLDHLSQAVFLSLNLVGACNIALACWQIELFIVVFDCLNITLGRLPVTDRNLHVAMAGLDLSVSLSLRAALQRIGDARYLAGQCAIRRLGHAHDRAEATPTAMIAPISEGTLSVVLVINSIVTMPHKAGSARITTKGSANSGGSQP